MSSVNQNPARGMALATQHQAGLLLLRREDEIAIDRDLAIDQSDLAAAADARPATIIETDAGGERGIEQRRP